MKIIITAKAKAKKKKKKVNEYAVCFAENTNITMEDGTAVPIQEVKIGDRIITHLGRSNCVTNTFKHTINNKILKIKVSGVCDPILVTQEHPFYGMKSNRIAHGHSVVGDKNSKRWYEDDFSQSKLQWIPANNLQKGDAIHSPSIKMFSNNLLNIDEDTAFIMGVYCAEGSLNTKGSKPRKWKCGKNNIVRSHIPTEKSGKIVLSLHKDKDKKVINFIKKYCKNRFGKGHFTVSGPYARDPNSITVIIKSLWLTELCKKHVGCGSHDKKLSLDFMASSTAILKSFIFGYFLGDGTFDISYKKIEENKYTCFKNNGMCKITATSASKNLINQLFWLCEKCGIVATTRRQKQNGGPLNRNKIYYGWLIELNTNESLKFNYLIKKFLNQTISSSGRKGQRFAMAACTFGKVVSIEKIDFFGDVYNLEVEEDNSYVANLCSVHNCTVSVGREDEAKYKRCKEDIKKEQGGTGAK